MSHNLQHRLQGRRRLGAALLFSAGLCAMGGASSLLWASQPPSTLATGSLVMPAARFAPAPYEKRIMVGRKGRQRLFLAARLEEFGGLIRLPVGWRVRRLDAISGRAGRIVFDEKTPQAELALAQGAYEVDIRYGYRHARQRITIGPGEHVHLVFNLNVGGVRTLAVVENLGVARGVRTEQKIYALSGPGKGRLVASWSQPGRILRLAAGDYRIESRFLPGNALAKTRVRVKPGILTTLKITAQAGVARIEPAGDGAGEWVLRDAEGMWKKSGSGRAVLVLAPGRYMLEMHGGAQPMVRRFAIAAGREVVLHMARED